MWGASLEHLEGEEEDDEWWDWGPAETDGKEVPMGRWAGTGPGEKSGTPGEDKGKAEDEGAVVHKDGPYETDPRDIRGIEELPGYDWGGPQAGATKSFVGAGQPSKLGANEWKYNAALYPALLWYWRSQEWDERGRGEVSWAELAIDFQATTPMELSRGEKDWKEETLAARAQIMAAATRRMETIC